MIAMPPNIVIQGQRNVKSSTRSYVRCTHLVMALPSVLTFPGLMMRVSKKGMMVTANISDTIKLIVMVMGKSSSASWNEPVIVIK